MWGSRNSAGITWSLALGQTLPHPSSPATSTSGIASAAGTLARDNEPPRKSAILRGRRKNAQGRAQGFEHLSAFLPHKSWGEAGGAWARNGRMEKCQCSTANVSNHEQKSATPDHCKTSRPDLKAAPEKAWCSRRQRYRELPQLVFNAG